MSDIEKELKKLMDAHDAQNQQKEKEYTWLATSVALATAIATLVSQLPSFIPAIQPYWRSTLIVIAGIVIVTAITIIFAVRAHRSELGISGYLKVERTLLINEMPNVFQILSLLGFLNVLLKQQVVKIAVTVVLTFLLMIYLTSKRRDMVAESRRPEGKITGNVTTPLTIVLGSVIGTVVYALASLISVQLK